MDSTRVQAEMAQIPHQQQQQYPFQSASGGVIPTPSRTFPPQNNIPGLPTQYYPMTSGMMSQGPGVMPPYQPINSMPLGMGMSAPRFVSGTSNSALNNNSSSNSSHNNSALSAISSNLNAPFPFLACNIGLAQGSHKESVIYEINLQTGCTVEGLHIVPFDAQPPGLPATVDIKGKTRPEISQRSFLLKMYLRNAATHEVSFVHEWSISGGVQWLPLPPAFQMLQTDYLAFGGDFDMITVLIYGKALQRKELSVEVLKNLTKREWPGNQNKVMPAELLDLQKALSSSYDTSLILTADDSDDDDDSDSINGSELKVERSIRRLEAATTATFSLQKRIKRSIPLEPHSHVLENYYHVQFLGPIFAHSKVSASAIGELSQQILAQDASNFDALGRDDKLAHLKSMTALLDQCWSPMVSDTDCPLEIVGSIGEEAAAALATIVVKSLDCLRCDLPNVMFESFEDDDGDSFIEFAITGLSCCYALLRNEFTAKAFADMGGLSLLTYLCNQQPGLPSNILLLIVNCLRISLFHASLVPFLTEPPSNPFEYSAYQTLLYLYSNLKSSSSNHFQQCCREALKFCSFIEVSAKLKEFSAEIVQMKLISIAESISLLLSMGNSGSSSLTSFTVDSKGIDGEESSASHEQTFAYKEAMTGAIEMTCEVMSEFSQLYIPFIESFEDLIINHRFTGANHRSLLDEDDLPQEQSSLEMKTLEVPTILILQRHKILSVLLTSIQVIQLAQELFAFIEWDNLSGASQQKFQQLLHENSSHVTTILSHILGCGRSELLFVKEFEECNLLLRALVTHDNVALCHLLSEFANLGALKTFSLPSFGWLPSLMVLTFHSCERIFMDLSNAPQNRSVNISDAIISEWMFLEELCLSAATAAVVARVYSTIMHLMHHLLNTAMHCLEALEKAADDDQSEDDREDVDIFDDAEGSANQFDRKTVVKEGTLRNWLHYTLTLLSTIFWSDDVIVEQNRSDFKAQYLRVLSKNRQRQDFEFQGRSLPVFLESSNVKWNRECKADSSLSPFESFGRSLEVVVQNKQETNIADILDLLDKSSAILSSFPGFNVSTSNSLHSPSSAVSVSLTMFDIYNDERCPLTMIESATRRVLKWTLFCCEKLGWMRRISPAIASSIIATSLPNSALTNADASYLSLSTEDEEDGGVYCIHLFILFRTMLKLVAILRTVVISLALHVSDESVELYSSVYFICNEVVGWQRSGEIGSIARRIMNTCTEIFLHQLLSDAENTTTNVTRKIIRLALNVPQLKISNCQLLAEIISTVANSNSKATMEDAPSHDNKRISSELLIQSPEGGQPKSRIGEEIISVGSDVDVDIITLMLHSLESSSQRLHSHLTSLIEICMGLGDSMASNLSFHLVNSLAHRIALITSAPTAAASTESENSVPAIKKEAMTSEELSLHMSYISRLLLLIEALLGHPMHAISFAQQGLLHVLFSILKDFRKQMLSVAITTPVSPLFNFQFGVDDVLLLSLQCLASLYRSLSNATVQLSTQVNHSVTAAELASSMKKRLYFVHQTTSEISNGLTILLPNILKSSIETSHWSLVAQCITIVPLLPPGHLRCFMQSIASTIASVESLAVRLWIAFEDAFQQFMEATEIRKNLLSHSSTSPGEQDPAYFLGMDNGETRLAYHHIAVASTSHALRCIMDLAYAAYIDDIITLASLKNAIRSSLGDPRKVAVRYQRSYTMWTTDHISPRLISISRNDTQQLSPPSLVLSPQGLSLVSKNFHTSRCSNIAGISIGGGGGLATSAVDSFESRHVVITASLRNIVDIVGKAMKYIQGREEKESSSLLDSDWMPLLTLLTEKESSSSDLWTYFKAPLSELRHHGDGRSPSDFGLVNTTSANVSSRLDAVHSFLRRGIVYGDDYRWGIYDLSFHVAVAPLINVFPPKDLATMDTELLKSLLWAPKQKRTRRDVGGQPFLSSKDKSESTGWSENMYDPLQATGMTAAGLPPPLKVLPLAPTLQFNRPVSTSNSGSGGIPQSYGLASIPGFNTSGQLPPQQQLPPPLPLPLPMQPFGSHHQLQQPLSQSSLPLPLPPRLPLQLMPPPLPNSYNYLNSTSAYNYPPFNAVDNSNSFSSDSFIDNFSSASDNNIGGQSQHPFAFNTGNQPSEPASYGGQTQPQAATINAGASYQVKAMPAYGESNNAYRVEYEINKGDGQRPINVDLGDSNSEQPTKAKRKSRFT